METTDGQTQKTRKDESERDRGRRRAILALIILALVIVALLLSRSCWRDPNARRGHYEGKSEEEIREDLDAEVGWESMEISVASVIECRAGETRAEARIENIEANHCDQKVRGYLADDPGDVLFETGAIAPGEYLQYVELTHPLEPGTYDLVVEFQGYVRATTLLSDEGVPLGHDRFGSSCMAEVELRVLDEDA